ncbi:acyltransferase family protein [Streptomyces niger]|uniref:acyltransferase family protein n=1 Tax=Streptomyces niger TaxID=66373 RepID=UPI000DA61F28|nr:acyltransferase [Streptomyces niger]
MNSYTPQAKRCALPSLTGMRFVAAALVFVSHVAGNRIFADGQTNNWFFDLFNPAGWLGVGFFFILSGFVLTWSAREGDTVTGFWRRRLAKIFPNHLVTWLAGFLLMAVTGEVLNAFYVIPSAFLVHTWIPRMDALTGTNGPSWSLCCELVFYLAFPFVHRLVRKIRPARLWAWAIGVVAAIAAWAGFVYVALPKEPEIIWAPMPFWHFFAIYNPPPVRMLDFLLGMLLAQVVISGRWIRIGWPTAIAGMVAGYAAMVVVPPEFGMMAVTAAPLGLLIAKAAAADIEAGRSPFRGRVMIWLGEVSFAFYMVHYLVLHFTLKALGDRVAWTLPEGLAVAAVLMVATLGVAYLLYRYVEMPVMRRLCRSRKPAVTGSVATMPAGPRDGSDTPAADPGELTGAR